MNDTPAMPVNLGCIGCGNMGSAILKGLKDAPDLTLYGTDLNRELVENVARAVGLTPCDGPKEIVAKSDYILVCIKPHQVPALLKEMAPRLRPNQVIISIAAGLPVERLKEACSGVCPVVRVMPNTPAMVGEGVFAVCLDDPTLKDDQKEFISGLFAGLGQTHVLAERYFDAFTAVAGSGPAYVFYFMEALVEAGVALGLTREQSTQITKGLFTGSAKLAAESEFHLSVLREMVTSPAGTTIEATMHMDAFAVRGQIIEAVKKCAARSKELGKK